MNRPPWVEPEYDKERINAPGKFEGETRATELLWEQGEFDEQLSHESFGFWGLVIIGPSDVGFAYPAYVLHEDDNGFVTGWAADTIALAYEYWEELVEEYGEGGDEDEPQLSA